MKLTMKILAFIIPLFLFNACNKDDEAIPTPQSSTINKIMPLVHQELKEQDLNMRVTDMNFGKT